MDISYETDDYQRAHRSQACLMFDTRRSDLLGLYTTLRRTEAGGPESW